MVTGRQQNTKAMTNEQAREKSKPAGGASAKKLTAEEKVKQAYKDVLGREADAGGLQYYTGVIKQHGLDYVTKSLATSDEAAKRGVDPTKFGAKKFDPAQLKGKYQPYYEQWKAKHGNRVFTDFDALRLKWDGDAYSTEAYGQVLAGTIKDGVISQEAVQVLGPDLSKHFTGSTGGQGYLFPTKTIVNGQEVAVTLKGDTFGKTKAYKQDGAETGYSTVQATGNLSSGLVGELGWKDPVGDLRKIGVGKDVIGALGASRDIATLGLADIDENILFGQRGSNQIDPWSAKAVGMSEKKYNRSVGYGQFAAKTAAQAVLTATSAGAPVAMALEAGWQLAKAAEAKSMRTDFDWANAAVSALAAGIQVPGNAVIGSAVKAGAVSAGYDALSGRSVNWNKAAEAAAVGGVGAMGLAGNVGGIDVATSAYTIAKADNKSDAWAAVAIQAGVGAAGAKAQGRDLYSIKGSAFDTSWKRSFAPGGSRAGWNPGNAESWQPVTSEPSAFDPDRQVTRGKWWSRDRTGERERLKSLPSWERQAEVRSQVLKTDEDFQSDEYRGLGVRAR